LEWGKNFLEWGMSGMSDEEFVSFSLSCFRIGLVASIYFLVLLYTGEPWFKIIAITALVVLCLIFSFGQRWLERGAFGLGIICVLIWLQALPNVEDWRPMTIRALHQILAAN
jgi:hypothetical protein